MKVIGRQTRWITNNHIFMNYGFEFIQLVIKKLQNYYGFFTPSSSLCHDSIRCLYFYHRRVR